MSDVCKDHKGQMALRHYAIQPAHSLCPLRLQFHIYLPLVKAHLACLKCESSSAFNQEKARDCKTLNFVKVCFQLCKNVCAH